MYGFTRRLRWLAVGATMLSRVAVAQAGSGYRVTSFTTHDGLPSQSISDIAETSDGFLWIAAGGILARFDGYQFVTYSEANAPALARRVVHLHAGIGDTLWILDEGNAVLAYAAGKVLQVIPPSSRFMHSIVQDGRGTLFGIGGESVWRLQRGVGADAEVVPRIAVPRWAGVQAGRDGSGRAWIVDSSLVLREVGGPARPEPRTFSHWAAVTSRAKGEVYAVRARGTLRDVVRSNGDVVGTFRASPTPTPGLVDREGRLWAVGAERYDVYEGGRADPVAQIRQNEPGTTGKMIEGEWGCVWVTELTLLQVCRVPFREVPLTLRARPFVARGPTGAALTWDATGRVVVLTPTGVQRPLDGAGDAFLQWARVHIDRRGTVWWSPLINADAPKGEADPKSVRLLPHRSAYVFADDPTDERVLWYAAGDHLYRAELTREGRARLVDSIAAGGLVTAMAIGSDRTLWATVTRPDLRSQLVRVAGREVATYSSENGLPPGALRAVLPDKDGTVWLGTYGGGLVRYRGGLFQTVTERDGLGENVVTSLLDDGAGNLWMGGNRTVHRAARRELDAFLDGKTRRVRGVVYGQSDGLVTPETSGYPGVRDDSGRFWFPTIGGAAVVDPRLALSLDSTPPRVHILQLRTRRDTVDGARVAIRLAPGERRVTVVYTGIALRNSAAVHYEYRTDGVDNEWIDAGGAREATYNDVGPGTHTFRVRAINAGGVASVREATITFTVPPAFHETPAFFALLLATIGALAWAAVRVREQQMRRRERLLQRAVDERTASLEVALSTVAAQADQLRTLDVAKSRFFANVSHEFRTPLSLIVGPVEDLRDGRAGELSAAVRRRLEGVHNNARRLLQLVEQLLDIARLESGTLQLTAEVRDLLPLLRRMADSFASLAEHRGINFRLSCPVGTLRVRYDPDQMEKVIGNLVGNALKFTPTGGEVELRATSDSSGDGAAVIEVQDTGPGISPEFHARIFERFFQVDDSSRRAHEGTGIGLALVRELVELHGGTVGVKSTLGQGSTFFVRLRLASGGSVTSPERPMLSAATSGTVVHAQAPSAPHRVIATTDATTVLVVEDNAELLEFLREHLAERFRVLVAENGVRGLEMARAHVPDLIVSDVMMPGMDGQSLCEAVKADAEIDFVPVILLTARASRDSRLAGLAGGADDYLTKPVDLTELLIRAENLIASRRRVHERWRAANQTLPIISVPVKAPPRDASERALLESLTAVLGEYLADEDFDIEGMAAAMGMGRSTLYRKLQPLLGKSPMDTLWEYRLAQAAQWLTETSITVSEVAYGVGFKSVPHFCGRFRERYGETPSTYRRTTKTAAIT